MNDIQYRYGVGYIIFIPILIALYFCAMHTFIRNSWYEISANDMRYVYTDYVISTKYVR